MRKRVHDLVEVFFSPLAARVAVLEGTIGDLRGLRALVSEQSVQIAQLTQIVSRLERMAQGVIAAVGLAVIGAVLSVVLKR